MKCSDLLCCLFWKKREEKAAKTPLPKNPVDSSSLLPSPYHIAGLYTGEDDSSQVCRERQIVDVTQVGEFYVIAFQNEEASSLFYKGIKQYARCTFNEDGELMVSGERLANLKVDKKVTMKQLLEHFKKRAIAIPIRGHQGERLKLSSYQGRLGLLPSETTGSINSSAVASPLTQPLLGQSW